MAAAADLSAGRPVVVDLDGGPVELVGDEIELRVQAQSGFAVSRDGAEVVALDLTLDDGLRRRGLAREVIRHVQDVRKAAGLDVSDWIHLMLVGLDDLEPMFESIAREVLARSVTTSPPEDPGAGPGTRLEIDAGESVREATVWVIKA
jgi:isoleucyl-tRNA synthetase